MVKTELLRTITLINYPRKIKLANSIRPKYFKHTDKNIPKKYLAKPINEHFSYYIEIKKQQVYHYSLEPRTGYIWKLRNKNEVCLFNTETNEFVVKNAKAAGKERWTIINGQKIYNGEYHPAVRAKVMETIHNWIISSLQGLQKPELFEPIRADEYPLYIECELHDKIFDEINPHKYWDVFNRAYPFCKAFEDVLQKLRIIEGDDMRYITTPCHPSFVEIKEDEVYIPKLVFNIYKVCQ